MSSAAILFRSDAQCVRVNKFVRLSHFVCLPSDLPLPIPSFNNTRGNERLENQVVYLLQMMLVTSILDYCNSLFQNSSFNTQCLLLSENLSSFDHLDQIYSLSLKLIPILGLGFFTDNIK